MSRSLKFVQKCLREIISPPGRAANVESRIRLAAHDLGWSFTRTKDAWYADPRVSIDSEEMRVVEEKAGVRYGADELQAVEELIRRADALLKRPDADRFRPFVAAFRVLAGTLDRT
ncbi:hypothetical protein QN224_13090 [Sinorhizobium sp. 8-89]|uniref:hypothetical protein n=1 Tax=Sinorhizobium sp. 7-81 TaxID=3049087 RepID=UPI0024C269CB|nr:hypothetical protein [Sinorhizobium sp. 7-81]MDK1386344.1 hypothetical protein [Sinorhizobium sp. 7-81]